MLKTMRFTRTLLAVSVIVFCLAGCSSNLLRAPDAVDSYLVRTSEELESCMRAREPLAETRANPEDVSRCAKEARADVAPLLDKARRHVQHQRGTTMYLNMYQAQWTAALEDLARSAQPTASADPFEADLANLRELRSRLH